MQVTPVNRNIFLVFLLMSLLFCVAIGFRAAFSDITNKKVVTTLSYLFENPLLDPSLRALIRQKFPEFLAPPGGEALLPNQLTQEGVPLSLPEPSLVGFKDMDHNLPAILEETTLDSDPDKAA